MAEDLIGYDLLTQEAMRSVVRAALTRAATPRGLPGRHHFYITFRTMAAGVVVPDFLASRYPDEMTIVLEHQFWDLEVFPDRFRVILKFQGAAYPVVVPFVALTRFYDPSVRFGLQFESLDAEREVADEPSVEETAPPQAQAASGQAGVVSLDQFRKKT